MNKLPKLYRPVKIKFWSLRNGLGSNYGMIFDIDRQVERTCMRVLNKNGGWFWQIKNIINERKWNYDYFIDQDQEILAEYGSELEFEIVTGTN
jgi:hypothetical protein